MNCFFLEKLKNLIVDQELDLRRLKNGIQPRRAHTRTNKERNTKIINAQKSLIEKRYYFVNKYVYTKFCYALNQMNYYNL